MYSPDHSGLFGVSGRCVIRERDRQYGALEDISEQFIFRDRVFGRLRGLGRASNGVLADAAYAVQTWLSWIGGLVIIFFGLYLMGFFRIGFLEYEHKLNPKLQFHSRYLTSLLFGFAFAAGWTPCVGPVLGGILGLAASAPGEAFPLLFAYALGLGVPFLVVGAFVAKAGALYRPLCRGAPLCDDRVRRNPCRAWYPRLHTGPFARGEFWICE